MEKRAMPWRRWIAMTLAVILTFGSLGSSLAPLVSAEEASGTNTIVNEGFEDFTPNEAADVWTEGSWQDVKQWNGASKSSWSAQVASGKVKVDANVTGGHSGDYCVKVTPDTTAGGRAFLRYNLTSAETAQVVSGGEYIVKAWIKAETGTVPLMFQFNGAAAKGKVSDKIVVGTEWTQIEWSFTAEQNGAGCVLMIAGHYGNQPNAYYVDDVTLEKVAKAEESDSVSIPQKASVSVGKTVSLTAAYPEGKTISWSSDKPDVAKVEGGVVTGVSAGTAIITATVGTATAQCEVTVTAEAGDGYVVNESFEDFTPNDVTDVWSTGDPATWNGASKDSWTAATMTGKLMLEANVSGGHSGDYCVKVTPAADGGRVMVKYKLQAEEYQQIKAGSEYTVKAWAKTESGTADLLFQVTGIGAGGGSLASWSTPNKAATEWQQLSYTFTAVTDGKAGMVLMVGTTGPVNTVWYLDDVTLEKVPVPDQPDSIAVPGSEKVTVGESIDLRADFPKGKTISWSSDKPEIAKVEGTKLTGISAGTATITATVGSASASFVVTVEESSPYIVEEGFENFIPNDISNEWSNGDVATWNGASNTHWVSSIAKGSALVQANVVEDLHSGKYSVKVTPDKSAGGRAFLKYTLTGEELAQLEEGGEYVLKIWVKAEADNVPVMFQVNGATEKAIANYDYKATKTWRQLSYTFKATKVSSQVILMFATQGVPVDAIWVDDMTLESLGRASAITLSKEEAYVETGKTLKLDYTVVPATAKTEVTFASSNEKVATVAADGTVTAVAAGDAVITAVAINGMVRASCTIHVVDKYVALTGISMEKAELTLNPGGEETVKVVFAPADATERKLIWSSNNNDVAVVDENGVVTAVGGGSATITARSGSFSAVCTVTVTESGSFESKTESVSVGFGQRTEIDLSAYLDGSSYKVLSYPEKGMVSISGSKLYYTSYTWLMSKDYGFVDQEYSDNVKVTVKNGSGETAVLTLNITIGKLEALIDWNETMDLLFSEAELAQIRKEAQVAGSTRNKLFKELLAYADELMATNPGVYEESKNTSGAYDYGQWVNGENTMTFAIAYLLTKDVTGYEAANAKYLNRCIDWLKASLSYPFWGTYPIANDDIACSGQLMSCSFALHWLKDELKDVTCNHRLGESNAPWTENTISNQPILEALEQRIWKAAEDLYNANIPYYCYNMNHSLHRMTGLMTASIAMQEFAKTDEQKAKVVKWMGMALYKDGYGFNSMMPDGTSQEGVSYGEFGAMQSLITVHAARTAVNIDLLAMTGAYRNFRDFVLYNGLPSDSWNSNQSILNMADNYSYHTECTSAIMRMLAAEYNDGTAQWLARVYEEQNTANKKSNLWTSVMYANPSIKEVAPTTQTLKWFKDIDHVISRSDWSGNEDLLSIKSGVPCGKNLMKMVQNGTYVGDPDAGHAHPDANHITLWSNGEYLLRDDGYADKFAAQHNTLLVNGSGQLGEGSDWLEEGPYIENNAIPNIAKVVEVNDTENGVRYDYIVGDATEAYATSLGLDKFHRHLVFLKDEQVLLVVDDIKTLAETNLELRWFPASKAATWSGGIWTVKSDKNTMNYFAFNEEAAPTFEDVTVVPREGPSGLEKTFRQCYTGTQWQNAVAFSWNEASGEAAYVKYQPGENANEHIFGINGKIYTINVADCTVIVTEGDIESTGGGTDDDSTLANLLVNGVFYDAFDPNVTEYTIDRWWKTYDLTVDVSTSAYGANAVVDQSDPEHIKITCTARDGVHKTVYTLNITNSNRILGIKDAWTNVEREGYYITASYDNWIGLLDEKPCWTCKAPDSGEDAGHVLANYDLGEVVSLDQIDIAIHNSAIRDSYYDVCYSVDGKVWNTLIEDGVVTGAEAKATAAVGSNHGMVTIYNGDAVQMRYIKVVLRGNSNSGKDVAAFNGIHEITFHGLPEGELVVPESGYAAGVTTADKDVNVGDTVNVNVKVESNEFGNFASGELKLTYDASILEFNQEASRLGSATIKVDAEAGILTLEDYGNVKSFGTAYTLAFTAKTAGSSVVTLTEAAFSTQEKAARDNLIPATISAAAVSVKVTLRHDVELPDIFNGESKVEDGKDYTFTVKDGSLYDYSDVKATVAGQDVEVTENGDGSYTVKNVTGKLVISGTRAPRTFTVTIKETDKADRTETATYKTDYVFTIPSEDGYNISVSAAYADGRKVPTETTGDTMTIRGENITGDITITVTKTLIPPTTATVKVEGNAVSEVTFEETAKPDTDYTFTVAMDSKYDYTVSAKNGEKDLELTEGENGAYTISSKDFAAGDTIVITVNKTVKISNVEVKDYLTINEAKIWLILVNTDKMESGTYTYQSNKMYWSEKYNAYCYLVISGAEKPVITAEDLAIVNESATEVDYGMDVNMSGKLDANDAQLVYNMYNAHYSAFADDVSMEKFLRADTNFDCTINVEDAQAIINKLLS